MKSVTVVFGREQGQSDSVPSLDLSIHHCLYRGGGGVNVNVCTWVS